jgi:hypothetical protein
MFSIRALEQSGRQAQDRTSPNLVSNPSKNSTSGGATEAITCDPPACTEECSMLAVAAAARWSGAWARLLAICALSPAVPRQLVPNQQPAIECRVLTTTPPTVDQHALTVPTEAGWHARCFCCSTSLPLQSVQCSPALRLAAPVPI